MIRLFVFLFVMMATPLAAHDRLGQVLMGKVVRVIDGDTFDVSIFLDLGPMNMVIPDVRVRLDCLDAPEKWTDEGKELKILVNDWIEGKMVQIRVAGDGGFGRVLASVKPMGWGTTLEARLYHLEAPRVPLYTGSQTTQKAVDACRQRLDQELKP